MTRSRRIAGLALVVACGGPSSPTTSLPAVSTISSATSAVARPTVTASTTIVSADATAVEIVVPAGDLELAATLTMPAGPGPHPIAVIIGGSGPVDRDGTMPGQLNMGFPRPIQLHAALAEGLADRGIATVRYDKRSCGPFNSCGNNDYPIPSDDLVFGVFVADAGAVVAWAASDDRFDDVMVIGHSQGGTIAALLADRTDVDAAVMLGTPFRSIHEVLAEQAAFSRRLAESLGIAPAQVEAAVRPIEDLAGDVADIAAGTSTEPAGGFSAAFWASWVEASAQARTLAPAAQIPVLAMSGSMDWNVPPSELQLWGMAGVETELLECLTHAFNCVPVGEPADVTPADVGTEVDPVLFDRIADVFGG